MEIKNLNKSFDNKLILQNINIKFPDVGIVSIVGSSGAGKTTLLNILLGLNKDYEGELLDFHKKVSCVFQEDRLLKNFTVYENIACVMENPDKQKINAILCELDIEGSGNKFPGELSGGMKRRVAIARALVFEYDLLILDEPFNGLDEKRKNLVTCAIKKRAENKLIILVTHDVEIAKDISKFVYELD